MRERGLLGGRGFDLFPDDSVGLLAAGGLDGGLGAAGDRGVDALDGDRPVAFESERPELVDDDRGILARDVGEQDIAGRADAGAGQADDAVDGWIAAEDLLDLLGPLARGTIRRCSTVRP